MPTSGPAGSSLLQGEVPLQISPDSGAALAAGGPSRRLVHTPSPPPAPSPPAAGRARRAPPPRECPPQRVDRGGPSCVKRTPSGLLLVQYADSHQLARLMLAEEVAIRPQEQRALALSLAITARCL